MLATPAQPADREAHSAGRTGGKRGEAEEVDSEEDVDTKKAHA